MKVSGKVLTVRLTHLKLMSEGNINVDIQTALAGVLEEWTQLWGRWINSTLHRSDIQHTSKN